MTADEQTTLLRIARQSIQTHLSGGVQPPLELPDGPLRQPAGAFVTLRQGARLRGCIGYITSSDPLADTVRDAAVRAATADPRFDPVTSDELADLHIEISVLSPLRRARPDEVRVGTHGLYVRRAGVTGLLLPQVAVEWKMSRDAFLNAVCEKAELPADAWRQPQTELSTFTAEVFGE